MLLRPTTSADLGFLERLLVEAFNWTGQPRVTLDQVRTDARYTHHLLGWQRATDLGVVAEAEAKAEAEAEAEAKAGAEAEAEAKAGAKAEAEAEAEAGTPTGAAWARASTAEDPGYGFVADDVPELGMAVLAPYRGIGLGSQLLDACLLALREAGHRAVSLSVEDGNTVARRLYDSRDFRPVGRVGGSDTLLLDL